MPGRVSFTCKFTDSPGIEQCLLSALAKDPCELRIARTGTCHYEMSWDVQAASWHLSSRLSRCTNRSIVRRDETDDAPFHEPRLSPLLLPDSFLRPTYQPMSPRCRISDHPHRRGCRSGRGVHIDRSATQCRLKGRWV